MFEPKYNLTDEIVRMLTEIAEAKVVIQRAKLLPKQELGLRRQAILRQTQSSTAIEGNMLSMKQVEALYGHKKVDAPKRDIYEVQNYLKTLKYIGELVKKKDKLTEKVLLKIHKLVTDKTLPREQSGKYRQSMVYVVRRRLGVSDEVVYTGPGTKAVPCLCRDLIKWIEKSEELKINPVIVAGIVHQEIAAIHPFADGNGRTARALATLILYSRGYDFRQLFALEDYYNHDRSAYYAAINIGNNYEKRRVDFTPWLEYFVTGFREEIEVVSKEVRRLSLKKVDKKIESKIYLTKSQQLILDWLDQMGRITTSDVVDVLGCAKRTAQLEMKKLKKLGIVKSVGKGPATYYLLK